MQTPHPLDIAVDDLSEAVHQTLSAFLDDRTLSATERQAHSALKAVQRTLLVYRQRQVAAASFERNGATDLTERRFRAAGHGLIDLTAERTARTAHTKVVSLFPEHETAS